MQYLPLTEILSFVLLLNVGLAFCLGVSGVLALLASLVTPRYPSAGEVLGTLASIAFGMFGIFALLLGGTLLGRVLWISF